MKFSIVLRIQFLELEFFFFKVQVIIFIIFRECRLVVYVLFFWNRDQRNQGFFFSRLLRCRCFEIELLVGVVWVVVQGIQEVQRGYIRAVINSVIFYYLCFGGFRVREGGRFFDFISLQFGGNVKVSYFDDLCYGFNFIF